MGRERRHGFPIEGVGVRPQERGSQHAREVREACGVRRGSDIAACVLVDAQWCRGTGYAIAGLERVAVMVISSAADSNRVSRSRRCAGGVAVEVCVGGDALDEAPGSEDASDGVGREGSGAEESSGRQVSELRLAGRRRRRFSRNL